MGFAGVAAAPLRRARAAASMRAAGNGLLKCAPGSVATGLSLVVIHCGSRCCNHCSYLRYPVEIEVEMRKIVRCCLWLSLAVAGAAGAEQQVFGWVEKVRIMPLQATIYAKLDSGALTSSMHAEDIEHFERAGEDWVRFRIEVEDVETGKSISKQLERPLHRDIRLRGAGGKDERPVVLLKLCIGEAIYEEQFSLRDRDNMHYPALLGRRTIQHLGLLDVTSTFRVKPACDKHSPVQADGEADADGIGAV
jgi:hypothetical protein